MSQENDEKSELVPRLRFPEFREVSGWQKTQLIHALKFQPGFPFSSKGFNGEGVGLRLIRNRDLRSDEKPVHFSGPYSDDFVVDNNDILVGMDGDFTPCVWKKGKALLNQRVGRVLPKEGSDQRFLFYLLSVHLKAIEDTTARTTVKHLSHSNVERICEPFPTWPEQQKIADCLSSLDELITAETQKLDAHKTHKKGLMQQLFPREGETMPRLRFPEFREAGEWEPKALGEAATFCNGRAYAKEELLDGGKYAVIRVGNFFTSDKWYYSDLELDDSKYCDDGDLLYAWSASFGPRIWRGGRSIYHYHIWKVTEGSGISKQFLFIALDIETERMKTRSANGIGMFHITKGTIESWTSVFPSLAEQHRIADCLSSLDDLITAQSQKIDTLKFHKKGLMQQLFPVLDEVPA